MNERRVQCVLVIGARSAPFAEGIDDAAVVDRTNAFLEYAGMAADVWHLEIDTTKEPTT